MAAHIGQRGGGWGLSFKTLMTSMLTCCYAYVNMYSYLVRYVYVLEYCLYTCTRGHNLDHLGYKPACLL